MRFWILLAAGMLQGQSSIYFQAWLTQDVPYIITDRERDKFLQLRTDEERGQFIEQFWLRYDPVPETPQNEFRDEHYRRMAYAIQHYSSESAGWRTDRGRIYVMYGPPDEIQKQTERGVERTASKTEFW